MPWCNFFPECFDLGSSWGECHLNLSNWAGSTEVENFFFFTCCCTFPISIPFYTYVILMNYACIIQAKCCCDCCCLLKDDEDFSSSVATVSPTVVLAQPVSETVIDNHLTHQDESSQEVREDTSNYPDDPNKYYNARRLLRSSDPIYRAAGQSCFDAIGDNTYEAECIKRQLARCTDSEYTSKLEKELGKKEAETHWAEKVAKDLVKEEKRERQRQHSPY